MSDKSPTSSNMWLRTLGSLIFAAIIVAVVFIINFVFSPFIHMQPKSATLQFAWEISTALEDYYKEYGKWPDYTGDGLFLNAARNAQLIRTLTGHDEINNPRNIHFLFFDRTAVEFSGYYRLGFHPETGVLLDLRGNPFRIAVATNHGGQIANPYPDDGPIYRNVIVWSFGLDGRQGAPNNPRTTRGSDDTYAWW